MANQFKTLSNLSKHEVPDLEDEVINLIEVRADLVPPPSLLAYAHVGYIQLGLRAKVPIWCRIL